MIDLQQSTEEQDIMFWQPNPRKLAA